MFAFPSSQRRRIRTTNDVDHLHHEIRRRTQVVSIFPNRASCLRLISAMLNQISEEWLPGRTYVTSEQGTDRKEE